VRKGDFRIKRFVQRQESTLIFVVDASGSAAFQRLAEVKGAIELLLAQAYVARTQVALIAFRGERAELLLPPTRSLVRARKSLAELPGGGPTPLAAGLDMALVLAMAEQAKGRTPLVLLLTDGKANVARDGTVDRAAGLADAQDAARHLARAGLRCVFVDTARWPGPANQAFAAAMAARYAPLPYVDAGAMRDLARSLSDPAPA
jgi:magnesium chelatase subunit D